MRIATFNVQNLRFHTGEAHLDGARDADLPEDTAPGAALYDTLDRRLTAAVLAEADADIVALQEVFDQATLDHFHDAVLVPAGVAPYPHRVCRPGNDGRGFNVAVMSRRAITVTSHAGATPASLALAATAEVGASEPIFRRDCLTVTAGPLTLFVCHLKAPYPDAAVASRVRRLEAAAVRRLIEQRFAVPDTALWLILGDLNEPMAEEPVAEPAIAPILPPFSVDLIARLPPSERWSYHQPPAHPFGRPDGFLASPALARRWGDAVPCILRSGLGSAEGGRPGRPPLSVGAHRPHASDHAALVIDLPGL